MRRARWLLPLSVFLLAPAVQAVQFSDVTVAWKQQEASEILAEWQKYLAREQQIKAFQERAKSGQTAEAEAPPEPYPFDVTLVPLAFQKLNEALSEQPFRPDIHYHLGLYYQLAGDLERAEKSYSYAFHLAKKQERDDVAFSARLNQANIYAEKDEKDKALQLYQEILETGIEPLTVKNNIEVLFQEKQGGGGGGGSSNNKDDQDQDQNKDQNKDPDPNAPIQNGKDQPQKAPQNPQGGYVKRLLEEIENQEVEIRGREYDKSPKERPRDKDW